jgi:hypothetical protein
MNAKARVATVVYKSMHDSNFIKRNNCSYKISGFIESDIGTRAWHIIHRLDNEPNDDLSFDGEVASQVESKTNIDLNSCLPIFINEYTYD